MQGLYWPGVRCRRCGNQLARHAVTEIVNRHFNICSSPATISQLASGRRSMAHILLVEDDADVQMVVSEFLGTLGHRVSPASSAEQARCLLAGAPVDLAVIDCLMSGEQGSSLAEHASRQGVPIILTSGDPHYIETASEHQFPFLPKPFRLTGLEELIAGILSRSNAG